MVRLRRIADRDRIFFVTTDLARGVAPLMPVERDLILEILATLRTPRTFLLLGYVVMPDHLHLLLAPQQQSLIRVMGNFKSRAGYAIARRRRTPGAVWQPRYFDNILRRVRDFWEKLEYIHQNPVEAGVVQRPEDWKWSSYRFYAKSGVAPILPDPVDLPADINTLLWPAPWR